MKISFPKQKLKTSSNHPFSGLKLSPFLPPPKVRDNRPHQPQLPEDLWDSQMENKPHTNQLTIIKSTIPQWFIVENRGDSFDVRTCQANPFVETTCTSSFWPVHSRKDVKLKSSLSAKTNDICWSLSLYVCHATCINKQKNHYHQVSITHKSPQDVLVTQVDVGWSFNSRFHLSNFEMDNAYIHRWWWII